jgi:hypothetical protein
MNAHLRVRQIFLDIPHERAVCSILRRGGTTPPLFRALIEPDES